MNAPLFSASHLKVACASCNLRELCLPVGMPVAELEKVEELVANRRRIKRGATLFRAGDAFHALYAVRVGFLKSSVTSGDGREQVTGFHMAGEIVGLDGISTDHHSCDTTALEDSDVCVIPYDRIDHIAQQLPALHHHFHRLMSREIVREQSVMLLLGSMMAEERLAAFILNLSQRFEARGYSKSEFMLRMTRAEIGSYLGLKLETVSRALSRFAQEGVIEADQKRLRLLDPERLREIVAGHTSCEPQKVRLN
ncbi:MAG: fumarate/nitrate reduction transcriptional regulator Fnr [Burkholderiaceae bacterium]